jgi:hypothetical protein
LLDFDEQKRQQESRIGGFSTFLSMRGTINLGHAGPKNRGLAKVD